LAAALEKTATFRQKKSIFMNLIIVFLDSTKHSICHSYLWRCY